MFRILILLAVVFLGFALLFIFSQPSTEAAARMLMERCEDAPYPPSCLDEEIPTLIDQGFSMEDAFKVVAHIADATKDGAYDYYFCHVVAHNLSSKETAKDPSKWTDVLARCPTGMCSNGCLHGAAQERFRSDVLSDEQIRSALPDLKAACPMPSPSGFTTLEQAACLHALGHLATYVTDVDVPRSLALCDAVTEGMPFHFTRTCYEGVFMQIYQPLDAEDHALVKNIAPRTPAEAEAFCAPYSGSAHSACMVESWPLMGSSALTEPDTLDAFCKKTPGAVWERRCLADMFTVIISILGFDWSRMHDVCSRFTGEAKEHCYGDAAGYGLSTDYRLIEESVAFCNNAEAAGVGDHCYDTLLFYAGYSFHEGSLEQHALCNALPGRWGAACQEGGGTTFMKAIIDQVP